MNTKPVGGGHLITALTIEGYLDVLAKLKPCPFFATVEREGGPIYISHVEKPGVKKPPLVVVYEELTGQVLDNQAAFYFPEIETGLKMTSSDVLAIRYAEMGLGVVGGNSFAGQHLRELIRDKLSSLLVIGSFRCLIRDHKELPCRYLTPAA